MGALSPGTVLSGTYRIVRRVGQGGMGDVYEATHARLKGRYAVKLLLGEVASRPEVFARFRREAEVTSALRHPNIVNVIDFNQTPAGEAFLVMEFLEGSSLGAEIERLGTLSLPRVVNIVGQVTSALTAAHARGVVHRDLKPENLFLVRLEGDDRETVKVVDFGISKVREEKVRLTQQAVIMGTPQYMSPEQALGKMEEVDARADQFALAVITYQMLAGRAPFRGDDVNAVLYQVVNAVPAQLTSVNSSVPFAVQAVVERALAKKREERYPTVSEFHRELARAAGEAALAPVTLPPPLARSLPTADLSAASVKITTFGSTTGEMEPATTVRTRRPPSRALVALLTVGVIAAAALLGSRFVGKPPPPPPASPDTLRTETLPLASVIELEHVPPGAQVTVDGVLREPPITVPRGSGVHRLRVVAPGYEPFEVGVEVVRDKHTVLVAMKELEKPAPPKPVARPVRVRPRPRPAPPPQEAPEPPKKKSKIITDI
jgi:eukaryotic-like serine/threonine-protein kinase